LKKTPTLSKELDGSKKTNFFKNTTEIRSGTLTAQKAIGIKRRH